jgi:hypothetical protein
MFEAKSLFESWIVLNFFGPEAVCRCDTKFKENLLTHFNIDLERNVDERKWKLKKRK